MADENDGRIHYRDTKREKALERAAEGVPVVDAKRRRRYLSRLSDEENEARLRHLDALYEHDLKQHRQAQAAERDRERDEHNARVGERIRAEVGANARRREAEQRALTETRRRVDEEIRRQK